MKTIRMLSKKSFAKGDVVRLKLGGPLMFVAYPGEKKEKKIYCSWFDKENVLRTEVFPKKLLMKYPLSSYHFSVEWGGTAIGFQEVSGLEAYNDITEFREGNEAEAGAHKIPGKRHYANVILKRGLVKGDNQFFQWFATRKGSSVERRDITVSLLNENNEPVFVWKIRNAFPAKIAYGPLNSAGNEVVMETLELAHEGFVVETI